MSAKPNICFVVPVDGAGVRVTAARMLMANRQEGLHTFQIEDCAQLGSLRDALTLTNKLIDAGASWADLVSFRHSAGVMGALIEAAHNRLVELQWGERGDGHAA